MRRILVIAYGFFVVIGTFVLAGYQPAIVMAQTPQAADQAQQSPAAKFIQDLGNQAIAIMSDQSLSQDQHTQKYKRILQDSFDMPTISHFVLGRAWDKATPDQQKQFVALFEQLILQTYGDHLNFYSGEKFQVTSARAEGDKDSVVSSEVTHNDGQTPAKIDWRVRNNSSNGKPAVLDVMIEGVSQSVTQRQEYASILQSNNGNMDALLSQLRQRVQQGSPGQKSQ